MRKLGWSLIVASALMVAFLFVLWDAQAQTFEWRVSMDLAGGSCEYTNSVNQADNWISSIFVTYNAAVTATVKVHSIVSSVTNVILQEVLASQTNVLTGFEYTYFPRVGEIIYVTSSITNAATVEVTLASD